MPDETDPQFEQGEPSPPPPPPPIAPPRMTAPPVQTHDAFTPEDILPDPYRTVSEGGSVLLAPFYLLFRPGFFFLRFGAACPVVLAVLAAWITGAGSAMDRIDMQAFSGLGNRIEGLHDSWASYWGFIALGSVCATLGFAFLRAGWFWLRVVFCGVPSPSFDVAFRIVALASLIESIPGLALAAAYVPFYASPNELDNSGDLITIIPAFCLIPLAFWSVWSSYRGVREVFMPKRLLAVIWFLIVPWVTRAIAFSALLFVAFFFMPSQPADVQNPQSHKSDVFAFEYPGNWMLDTELAAMEDGGIVTAQPWYQDAIIKAQVYERSGELEAELEAAADIYRQQGFELLERADLTLLGPWSGVGKRYDATLEGDELEVELLVVPLTEWFNVDLLTLHHAGEEDQVRPGFDMVLRSLKITTPDRAPPDLAGAYEIRSGPLTLEIPGNWSWNEEVSGGRGGASARTLEVYPHADGILRVMTYQSDTTPAIEVSRTIENFIQGGTETAREDVDSWGPFEGSGARVTYREERGDIVSILTVLVVPLEGDRVLEVQTRSTDASAPFIDPGYTHAGETMTLD